MDIKATDVKILRDKTGAGMMECKKALAETGGDFTKAVKILKELGLAAAQKRAGRTAKEGRIFCRISAGRGALLELSCETDFVAKNSEFKALGEKLVQAVLEKGGQANAKDFAPLVQEAVGKIKENIEVRRFSSMEAGAKELLVSYLHGEESRIGVLVKLTLAEEKLKEHPRVKEIAFDMALHTTAFAPLFLSRDQVGPAYLKEQEEIFTKQALGLGKPEKVLKGIVQGKLNKHLAEICLLDQAFVKDANLKVSKVLEDLGKEVGGKIGIGGYLYYKVGEEVA